MQPPPEATLMMLQIIADTKNKPRRQSLPAGFVIFLSDIRPDARYGLSPIVQFQLWAEVRVFTPGLGSAPSEAGSVFRWSLFHNFMDLLFELRLPGGRMASRATFPAPANPV